MVLVYGTLRATKILHYQLLTTILAQPLIFFDYTPIGRVLNRFSLDLEILDMKIQRNLHEWLFCFMDVVATFVVISLSTPWIMIVSPAVVLLYGVVQVETVMGPPLKKKVCFRWSARVIILVPTGNFFYKFLFPQQNFSTFLTKKKRKKIATARVA